LSSRAGCQTFGLVSLAMLSAVVPIQVSVSVSVSVSVAVVLPATAMA
jgi:hypothetical protein